MDWPVWIGSRVSAFLDEDPSNKMGGLFGDERSWGEPLIGYAAGDDPLFETFKDAVDPGHWTPAEIFSKAFPDVRAAPSELSVVSWILPQTDATKRDNRLEKDRLSHRWARSRIFGEQANDDLRRHLERKFGEMGVEAVAPFLFSEWKTLGSERFVFTSNWSERHVAHACGLGTFGLCDGLITPLGKAMRTGSVVVKLRLAPTPRPYTRYDEYCPYLTGGKCGACIARCPVGAISSKGHDKVKCKKFLEERMAPYVSETFGFEGYGCGLCQTGVPCESKIPDF